MRLGLGSAAQQAGEEARGAPRSSSKWLAPPGYAPKYN